MRGFVLSFVALSGLLVFMYRAHAQQDCPTQPVSSKPRPVPVSHHEAPYSAEIRMSTAGIDKDGVSESYSESIDSSALDSQGRRASAITLLSNGLRSIKIEDPIVGELIVWNAQFPYAKVLKYPTPVAGRQSCWKLPPENLDFKHDEPQFGLGSITCGPAADFNYPHCGRRNLIIPTPENTSPLKAATFDRCTGGLASMVHPGEKKMEDLGDKVIDGRVAHGCRETTTLGNQTSIIEEWVYFGFPAHAVYDRARPDGGRLKQTLDLTYVSFDEPNLKGFQPPENYQRKIYEMTEVPCNTPK